MNVSPIAGSTFVAPFEKKSDSVGAASGPIPKNVDCETAPIPKMMNTPRMRILTSVTTVSAPPLASVERAFSATNETTARSAYPTCQTGPEGRPPQ